MRRIASLLALTLAGALPGLASAQAPRAPTRAQVRAMLSGIEDVPSDDAFRRLGEGALAVLIELYADRSEPAYVRLRAVGASGAFPRPATRTFLLAVAQAEGESDLFVRAAVMALARAFGAEATRDLVPFLAHPEPVVRRSAARALALAGGGDEAGRALRARLAVEPDAEVREAIRRTLR